MPSMVTRDSHATPLTQTQLLKGATSTTHTPTAHKRKGKFRGLEKRGREFWRIERAIHVDLSPHFEKDRKKTGIEKKLQSRLAIPLNAGVRLETR